MREIVILSGKGGTGKTSLTAAFASLAQEAVLCDLDVDAPDLHLLLHPRPRRSEEFWSGHRAVIDPARCQGCARCAELCRYGAVAQAGDAWAVNPSRCEGCKVCVAFCPAGAIDFAPRLSGHWRVSDTRLGPLVHAQLLPGEENSGRLVALLRKEARELAKQEGRGLVLCDGSPGIGCPVISSLAGADLAVAVTEPTPSGRHDLARLAELAAHFRVAVKVIINKYDLNFGETARLKALCGDKGLPVAASLPHDPAFVRAMVAGETICEHDPGGLGVLVRRAWEAILAPAESGA